MPDTSIPFKNIYYNLSKSLYQETAPLNPPTPRLKAWNSDLAKYLGLNLDLNEHSQYITQVFSGQTVDRNSKPLAMAYAGHQFGHFNPNLGDGRAHLLGELEAQDGAIYDIQLKGSGPTKYSRQGDGLSPLGPVIREYLISEAMYFLGVPTTRSLAVIETGQSVIRDGAFAGAVLTRVARSHVRVGHFEYFAQMGDTKSLNTLIDFLIERSYPELSNATDRPFALFKAVVERQAKLVAQWMSLGFVHGVMNTDNTSVSGITIDYGPCAFLDETDLNKVFSSIDRTGRYAYSQQPSIMQWNLARFAEAILSTYGEENRKHQIESYEKLLASFKEIFDRNWQSCLFKKIGFSNPIEGKDSQIVYDIFHYFNTEQIDFTLGFRELPSLLKSGSTPSVFPVNQNFKNLVAWWKKLIIQHSNIDDSICLMNSVNPIMIPRNHVIERIIQSCYNGDYAEFMEFNKEAQTPYNALNKNQKFLSPPNDKEKVCRTFCGT